MSHEQPTHLDLFSGIGGFSLAFEAEGFRTIGFAEIDPGANSVLQAHWPETRNFGDVRNIYRYANEYQECECCGDPYCERHGAHFSECACVGCSEWDDEVGLIDCITGGVPCQPASAIGKMCGTFDERWLWPESIRITCGIRPGFGLFENPPSILRLDGGRAWNSVVSGFSKIGYDCFWEVIPAAAIGAGHLRERLFLLIADTNRERLEGHTRNGNGSHKPGRQQAQTFRHAGPQDLRGITISTNKFYKAQSPVWPVVDGLSGGLVEAAIRCVGNSVQPQVAQIFARAIYQLLTRKKNERKKK